MDEELIYADGYDDAIIGVGGAFNQRAVVYDIAKVLEVSNRIQRPRGV